MSVGLLITNSGDRTDSNWIPVATQAVFAGYWVPAAHLLGLQWVPLFETGTSVDKEDLPAILDELDVLKRWLTRAPPSLPEGMAEFMTTRLNRLAAELDAIRDVPEAEIFIG